jgi:alpha-1,2-mannosyltransferase
VSGTTVSGAAAGPGASESGSERTAPDPVRRTSALTPVSVIIAVATLLALGLRLYQLSRPGYLLSVTEYDDGPYFGSAIRLVNGAIPYRDFLLVQPPGITVLMIPAALLGKLTGTGWALATGRLLTAVAGAACVSAAGLLVRHRGVVAVTIACGLPAVYPDSVQAAHTVLVEPWLALFCLVGAVAIFDGDRLTTSGRRLAWGGAAFGFAGAIEVWAIFPVLVVAALSLRTPRRLARYLAGALVGVAVPVLPFAIIAPHGLYQGIVTAQVVGRPATTRISSWFRVKEMVGLSNFQVTHTTVALVVLLLVIAVVAAFGLAWIVTRRPPTVLEWFAVCSTVLIVLAFMWPSQFHYHFDAFLVPFLALVIALPVARLAQGTGPSAESSRPAAPWLPWAVAGVAGIMIVAMAADQAGAEVNLPAHVAYSVVTRVRQLVPAGACVITDQVSFTIVADRFVSDVPGCPLLVDSIGTDYALSRGRSPKTGAARFPAVVAVWNNAFSHAQYVWLSGRNELRIPWTPALRAYFKAHFVRILAAGQVSGLYRRVGLPRS